MSAAQPPIHSGLRFKTRHVIYLGSAAVGIGLAMVVLLARGRDPDLVMMLPANAVCTTCPASSLPAPATCDPTVPHNEMPTNEMPTNGLTAASLESNAALLDALVTHALVANGGPTQGDATAWRDLLAVEHAPELVSYIASCALDRCEEMTMPGELKVRFPGGFKGELGLCGRAFPEEDPWRDKPASPGCRERVSACVLARVNAIEARVPISMRGDGVALLRQVPVETRFRENHGTPIQSFKPCDRMCLWGDRLRRNCDWEPRYVGQCVRHMRGSSDPPRRVTLKLAPELRGIARFRICEGIYGCDDTEDALGAGASTEPVHAHGHRTEFPPFYALRQIPADTTTNDISFACPDNGPVVTELRPDGAGAIEWQTGYYSVMIGSLRPDVKLVPWAGLTLITGAPPPQGTRYAYGDPSYVLIQPPEAYPASEQQVFTYREGAFYGDIFNPITESRGNCPVARADQHACASDLWRQPAALLAARLCAGPPDPDATCFLGHGGACDAPGAAACTRLDPGPEGDRTVIYDACDAPGTPPWSFPYTTYLNQPCDLLTEDACERLLHDKVRDRIKLPDRPRHGRPFP